MVMQDEQPGYILKHLLLYVNIYNCNSAKVVQLSVLVTVERAFGSDEKSEKAMRVSNNKRSQGSVIGPGKSQ